MRAVGAARWFLSSTSIMALAAIFAPERAYATCTYDVPGTGIIALSGDMCSAAGPYSGVPPGYVAFSASGGGVITSTGGVTINNTPTPVANAFGVYANGGQINLTAGIADVQTSGATAYDFYARDGGAITFADGKIESTGAGASGLYASGAGSTITVTGAPTIETGLLGAAADGVAADMGGAVSLMNGGHITTYAGGSVGLFVDGSSSTITGAGLTVQSFGDSVSPPDTGAAFNNGAGTIPLPGLTLTNSTLAANGMAAFGVYTANGGSTALSGDTISTGGDSAPGLWASGSGSTIAASNGTTISTGGSNAPGVQADTGGQVTLNGGTVMTSGAGATGLYVIGANSTVIATDVAITTGSGTNNSAVGVLASAGGTATLSGGSVITSGISTLGLYATGAGSSITTSNGTTVSTSGAYSNAVVADTGGSVTMTGGSVTATGESDTGIYVGPGGTVQLSGTQITGSGNGTAGIGIGDATATLTASGISIVTNGTYDPSTGYYANGLTNGGKASLANSTVATSGASSSGVVTLTGATTTLSNVTVTTSGSDANGVFATGGGSVTLNGGSVSTSGDNAYGLYATGAGSSIATSNGTTISTTGFNSTAVQADTGGAVTLNGGAVTASGAGSTGIFALGSGSTIIASGVAATTSGGFAPGGTYGTTVLAYNGGSVSFSGGSITNTGVFTGAVASQGSGSILTLSGTTILTTGVAGDGVAVVGAGASLTATGVSIATHGNFDSSVGWAAYGAYNGDFPDLSVAAGGTMSLTNTTIVTTGTGASGVDTNSGGSTALTNSSVTTSGQDADALVVSGSGSQASLSGSDTFATQGAGAIGLYATAGGGVTPTGPVTITTTGGVSPATGLGAYGVNADGAGSQIKLASASITTSGVGATGLFASDASSSGAAGSITVSGTLNIQTKNAAATAVALQGNGASILATGGGTIASAGDAIDFLGGKNQVATFDNFTIANTTGNLIFADPSVSTVNFNNTTANAGLNNLLDATNGSAITLNANASALTGAIQTDSTSTTAVNLTSGSVWTMTGSSTVSNLAVTNSAIVFAPPGSGVGFKTLTVGNYVGTGANLTMNTVLGGTGSASDQLVINGGSATGSTLLTIHNVGGAGAQTTGNGIPVVVVSNGGTTASNAFALGNTPVVGGYRYSLEDTNNDWYLVSSPTSTQGDIANSVTNVAKAQQQQIVTNRVLDSILIGATEQVNCSNCSSGFGSIGSYALGAHGRHSLSDELTVIGGFSYGEYSADGVTVSNAPSIAGSLIYDFVNWGRSRPFVEVGGGVTPFEDVQYSRTYGTGIGSGTGYGKAIDRNLGIFGRVGWVDRLTPIDEAAVYGDISRSWMIAGGYTEAAGPSNPYPATVQTGLDTLNVARVGGQYTHLFNGNIEVNVSAAVAYGFDAGSGNQFSVVDFGAIAPYPIANSYWLEYGGRVGYRLPNKMVLDAFLLGTAFGEIGKTLHGGVALRLFF